MPSADGDRTPIDLERVSLNQITVNRWTLPEALDGCARHDLRWIGLWRDKVAAYGIERSARLVRDSGLRVSSLCRGGFFPAATGAERRRRLDDNRRAVDEAVALGTEILVLVCGPAVDRDLDAAREFVEEGVAELAPYAAQAGVKLGVEPLHPMFTGSRSVIVTLAQANAMVEPFERQQVGVIVDAYHVWWDPEVHREIGRAAGRIYGFHVSDWLEPPPDLLLGRGLMGDGLIHLRGLRSAVEAAGYSGPVEVEIFNGEVWGMAGDDVLEQVKSRCLAYV